MAGKVGGYFSVVKDTFGQGGKAAVVKDAAEDVVAKAGGHPDKSPSTGSHKGKL